MNKSSISRRSFLTRSTGMGAGLALAGFPAPISSRDVNDRINIGIVGPGGRGTSLMKEFFEHNQEFKVDMVAICDLWNKRRDKATAFVKEKSGKAPKVYRHHEEILADNELDALIISTPDHAHAQILKLAAEAGKHAYCEKPMGNVLEEVNAAFDAVKKAGTIVQIGTQRRAWPKYRQAAKMIADGIIGDVVKLEIQWNAYSPYRWARKPKDLVGIKESDLDWNTWLMGKPYRPFDPRILRSFRLFKDFSSGIVDQWMTHGIDVAHMLGGLSAPVSAVAHGGIYQWKDYRENPDTFETALEYEKDGKKAMAVYATNLINSYGRNTRAHGTLGSFQAGGGGNWMDGSQEVNADPDKDWHFTGKGVEKAEGRAGDMVAIAAAPGTTNHMNNWLDALRHREPKRLYCNVDAGYSHSIACIMSTDAYWSGRRMIYDKVKRTIQAG